jgi:hypothetical protein
LRLRRICTNIGSGNKTVVGNPAGNRRNKSAFHSGRASGSCACELGSWKAR